VAKPTLADQLDPIVPEFDRLVAAARQVRDARHYDELESDADRIITKIRGAFRGSAGRG
jgi:hypothetical protein